MLTPREAYLRFVPLWHSTAVFCTNVAHAQQLATQFEQAEVLSGRMTAKARRAAIDRFRATITGGRVLFGVEKIAEYGPFDYVIIARPTFSRQRYETMMRCATHGVVDLAGNVRRFGFPTDFNGRIYVKA